MDKQLKKELIKIATETDSIGLEVKHLLKQNDGNISKKVVRKVEKIDEVIEKAEEKFTKIRKNLSSKKSVKKEKIDDLNNYENYFNREISLINFNKRVLAEALNPNNPLLERLKFAAIFSSNLDEFFMIRVAGLKSQIESGINYLSYDGKTPKEQLAEVRQTIKPIYKIQEELVTNELLPELEKHGIYIHRAENLTKKDKDYFREYFINNIFPVLTPLNLGPAHPFPRLINRSLNIAFILHDPTKKVDEESLAFLQLPSNLPRFLKIENRSEHHYVLIERIIKEFASLLFPGLEIVQSNTFRVTRDADIEIAEDEAEDLLEEIEEQVKLRKWGKDPVRLEVHQKMPERLVNLLVETLELDNEDVYVVRRPLNLPDFMSLMKIDKPELKDEPLIPSIPNDFVKSQSVFEAIKKKEIFVHHPFDSFVDTTVRFIEEAAIDKNVLAIKITLYRAGGGDSLVIKALQKAAEQGKNVTAFVELKARFDEENNIIWARELENSGVHVVYGILGLKTHCKIAMVVRKEASKLKTYLHISTGNYNQSTARLYTDVALFTARESFGKDAINLFNYLTGNSRFNDWQEFLVAPINLKNKFIEFIDREAEQSTPEKPGLIIAKMNSLAQREVIQALYRASNKGVKIVLIIRGVCCLRPGVKGLSENITVKSVIGRFLEHSRIFYFKNAGADEYYIGSSDWMTRNLQQRVELVIPILDKRIRKQLDELLQTYIEDKHGSWELLPNGDYKKLEGTNEDTQAQDYFLSKTKRYKVR
jgi:polyphosphate kinase